MVSDFCFIFVLKFESKMKANTKLNQLSEKEITKIVSKTIEFCVINLGKLKNKQYPKVSISYEPNYEFMGKYNPVNNEIFLYTKNCKTISDLTKTIIHEWTHTKQRILTEYNKLYKKLGYDNHPMEIEAYQAEKIWNRKVLNFIKKEYERL